MRCAVCYTYDAIAHGGFFSLHMEGVMGGSCYLGAVAYLTLVPLVGDNEVLILQSYRIQGSHCIGGYRCLHYPLYRLHASLLVDGGCDVLVLFY